MRRWKDESDLAARMLVLAQAGRRVVLTPETARIVAAKLITAARKPTRNGVARLICSSKCERLCYHCLGVANMIVNEYGERLEAPPSARSNREA